MRVSSSAMLTSPPKKDSAVGTASRSPLGPVMKPAETFVTFTGIGTPNWNDAAPPVASPKGLAADVRDGKFGPCARSSALHASRATVAISVSAVAAEAVANGRGLGCQG